MHACIAHYSYSYHTTVLARSTKSLQTLPFPATREKFTLHCTCIFLFLLQLGGPNYAVELGRLDGKTFNRAIVKHVLPGPGFNLDQLNSLFAQNGLTQTDMIALSGSSVLSSALLTLYCTVLYPSPQRTVRSSSSRLLGVYES